MKTDQTSPPPPTEPTPPETHTDMPRTVPVHTPHGRAAIEKAIREAAIAEFGRHGFRGASIHAIATRAGLTKPQLHYYIHSKQHLYESLLNAVLQSWANAFDFECDEPREALSRYVRRKLDYAIDHADLSRIFTSEVLSGGEYLGSCWPQASKDIDAKVRVINRWIDEGRLRPLDARLLLMQILSMTQHYSDYAMQARAVLGLAPGQPLERERIAHELISFVLHGCGLATD